MNVYDGSRSLHPEGVCGLSDGPRDAGLCRLRVRHVSVDRSVDDLAMRFLKNSG
jgi:hypothetical protein